MTKLRTYTPSGMFSPWFGGPLVLGVFVVLCATAVYQFALDWTFFVVLLNPVLVLAVGCIVGFVVRWVIRTGKIRNVWVAVFCGAVLSVSFVAGKFSMQYGRACLPSRNLTFGQFLSERVENGWQLSHLKAGSTFKLNGSAVYQAWAVEAGIVICIAGLTALMAASQPFDESVGQWATDKSILLEVPLADEGTISKLRTAKSVLELFEIPISSQDYLENSIAFEVASAPGGGNLDVYLSIFVRTRGKSRTGDDEEKTEYIVNDVVVSPETWLQVNEKVRQIKSSLALLRSRVRVLNA